MIVTSYTRLVVESHQDDCGGLLSGVWRRVNRQATSADRLEAYREREKAGERWERASLPAGEVADLIHVTSREVRGAA